MFNAGFTYVSTKLRSVKAIRIKLLGTKKLSIESFAIGRVVGIISPCLACNLLRSSSDSVISCESIKVNPKGLTCQPIG